MAPSPWEGQVVPSSQRLWQEEEEEEEEADQEDSVAPVWVPVQLLFMMSLQFSHHCGHVEIWRGFFEPLVSGSLLFGVFASSEKYRIWGFDSGYRSLRRSTVSFRIFHIFSTWWTSDPEVVSRFGHKKWYGLMECAIRGACRSPRFRH